MSSNWNVYKLFKSGKRAKAPIHTFIYEGDASGASQQFNDIEIKNLVEKYGEKIKKSEFKILNSLANQHCSNETPESRFIKRRNKVLAKIIKDKNINTKRKLGGGLVYSKDSNWKWQWAALEAATNNYIEGLSTHFDSYEEAIDWMNEKIQND